MQPASSAKLFNDFGRGAAAGVIAVPGTAGSCLHSPQQSLCTQAELEPGAGVLPPCVPRPGRPRRVTQIEPTRAYRGRRCSIPRQRLCSGSWSPTTTTSRPSRTSSSALSGTSGPPVGALGSTCSSTASASPTTTPGCSVGPAPCARRASRRPWPTSWTDSGEGHHHASAGRCGGAGWRDLLVPLFRWSRLLGFRVEARRMFGPGLQPAGRGFESLSAHQQVFCPKPAKPATSRPSARRTERPRGSHDRGDARHKLDIHQAASPRLLTITSSSYLYPAMHPPSGPVDAPSGTRVPSLAGLKCATVPANWDITTRGNAPYRHRVWLWICCASCGRKKRPGLGRGCSCRVGGDRSGEGTNRGFPRWDMFELPFSEDSFDIATSFNGIWKGCEGALSEARRVHVPAGKLGLTFWGRYDRLGLMPFFLKIIELSPPDHGTASMEQWDTRRPGVVEDMLAATGFEQVERGTVDVVNEWPDVETAVRALAAAGPSAPRSRPSATTHFVRRYERSYHHSAIGTSASGSHPSSDGLPPRRPDA